MIEVGPAELLGAEIDGSYEAKGPPTVSSLVCIVFQYSIYIGV